MRLSLSIFPLVFIVKIETIYAFSSLTILLSGYSFKNSLMKIDFNFILIPLILLITTYTYAQVGINTVDPDSSAMLDVHSTSKGFLMPRLSTVQRDAMILPARGLMIYNHTLNDGQINIGTPDIPFWTGIKDKQNTAISTLTLGTETSTESTDFSLLSGMTVSPPAGTYIAIFNAQISSSAAFGSDKGVTDAANLYDELMAYPGGVPHALTFGSGEVLLPGIYDVSGAPSIAGTLTMDGGGDADSVFIIRGSGAFSTGSGTTVILTGAAQPENIFWVSNVAMSTAANTIMKGTMLGGGTAAGAMSLGADSDLEGRLLTKLGAITLGAGVTLAVPLGVAPVDLGALSTFAMWSSDGGVSDVATATVTGDVGTASGVLTMTGTHVGVEYPAGTQSVANTTTFSMFQNGVEVLHSSRTLTQLINIVALQVEVNPLAGESIEVRWKVDQGESTISHRTLSLIYAQ
jgi:hypothetical protein